MSGSVVSASSGLGNTYSAFPGQQNTLAETPVSFEPNVYSDDDLVYQWASEEAQEYPYSSPSTGLFGSESGFRIVYRVIKFISEMVLL